jgi:8-oxo-dGTP diphosphatase
MNAKSEKKGFRRVRDVPWAQWEAVDTATLTFVTHRNQVLLIRKKRGLGAGKINGPGGRLEKGESLAECAVREVQEELGITPIDPKPRGELRFQFLDGYSIHVHVFTADAHRGEAQETAEAIPLWTPMAAIPYAEMWADDILWLPRVLAGETVSGYFVFDGDSMLDQLLT